MYMVKISQDKVQNLAEYAEKMLHYGGMLMHCVKELEDSEPEDGGYGERNYGRRSSMNYRYPMSEQDDDMGMRGGEMYGERRRRDSRGRYM